jgi:hypothetical protein
MRYTVDELQKPDVRTFVKFLVNGGPGTGKSYHGLTYPKVAWLVNEPGWRALIESNPELKANLAWVEEFIPSPNEDVKSVMTRLDTAIKQAHADFKEGKVDTLFFDNISFHAENRWLYINQFEPVRAMNGALDTRGMYGVLSRYLYKFTYMDILSFPGNVVVSCHEQTEDESAMQNKIDKSMTVAPAILGGFRDKIAGMFTASVYLEKRRKAENTYEYWARCQKGSNRDAKNRCGLPELIQNVSYKTIMEYVTKHKVK